MNPILSSVAKYFDGERREMIAIICGSVVVTLVAWGCFLVARDNFTKAALVSLLAGAVLLSATAGSLLVRDKRLRVEVATTAQSMAPEVVLTAERTRIDRIIANYPYYRFGGAGLGLVALVTLVMTRKEWAHGLAAGVLVLVVAQVAIDHYSELRAREYRASLAE